MSEQKKQYIVTMRCEVEKSVTCEGCTEQEARDDPFAYSVDEIETQMMGWEVLKVAIDE